MRFRLFQVFLISALAATLAFASPEPDVSMTPAPGATGADRPVVLVNGFGANCLIQWTYFALGLWEEGYDLHCMNFSDGCTAGIRSRRGSGRHRRRKV